MNERKSMLWWLVPAALFFAAGFAVATRWDFAISMAIFSPSHLLGRLMEAFGWLPAFLPALLLVLLWAAQGRHGPPGGRWRFPAGLGVYAGGLVALYFSCYHYLVKRQLAGSWVDWLWLAAGLLAGVWGIWWAFSRREEMRRKLWVFALTGSAFMLGNQILVNLLKFIWQRPRFDQMLADGSFAPFRPWYLPFGPGGSSFPSGHTANACGVFMLVVLCDLFPTWNRHRKLVYAVCWAYVGLMAFSRMMIGRHFLSDTLAAMALVALLFFAIRRTPVYRRAVAAVQVEENEHGAGEE